MSLEYSLISARACSVRPSSAKAKAFAEKYGIVQSAGSDAHTIYEIGSAYIEMPEFNGSDEFLQALARGKIYGRRSSLAVRLFSTWAKLKNRLRRL